jgi:hypothetical protein
MWSKVTVVNNAQRFFVNNVTTVPTKDTDYPSRWQYRVCTKFNENPISRFRVIRQNLQILRPPMASCAVSAKPTYRPGKAHKVTLRSNGRLKFLVLGGNRIPLNNDKSEIFGLRSN